MTRHSLRFRLLATATISVIVVLVITGLSVLILFEQHVERRVNSELQTYIGQIIANIGLTTDGRIQFIGSLADPRFEQPFSGLYWQIQDELRPTRLHSRSLWDNTLELPKDDLELFKVHRHILPGPKEQELLVRERQIIFHPGTDERRLRVAVAIDRQDLNSARDTFAREMMPYLILMVAILLLVAWLQIGIGLSPLHAVRNGINEIRTGTTRRLKKNYPDELMPLINELNELLAAEESAIESARSWTADLAHGLKTPLMVLTADAQRLRNQGNKAIAADLDQLADTMRRRVDRELIRARVRSGIQARQAQAQLAVVVRNVTNALKRTPRGESISWLLEVPETISIVIHTDDLMELLGNILDNAIKWAKGQVVVTARVNDNVQITIEDDGQGVPTNHLDLIASRGLRLDEQAQGNGLGLAIARDIVQAYHGQLSFEPSPLGGLRVIVTLPVSRTVVPIPS